VVHHRVRNFNEVVDIDLPRPRRLDSPGYLEKRDCIFRVMGMSLHAGETATA
jgi:NitT/TauT family transport system ATP-binding protein